MKTFDLIDEEYNDDYLENSQEDNEENEINEKEEQPNIQAEHPIDDDTWQVFGDLKVDDSFAIGNIAGTRNIYENFENTKLIEEIYDIYQNSKYNGMYEVKKPAKSDILEIVLYFLDRIQESESYSFCERIVAIADFMKIDYLTLFNELPQYLRYNIIKELDEQFNIIKQKSRKLF